MIILKSNIVFFDKYIIDSFMTILITGSAGFVGSALCLRLLDRGDQIVLDPVSSHKNEYVDRDVMLSCLKD